ncbi:Wzz/FepE/Etk N-terminal domain-containing protein [Sphingomonas sp. KC8]|uniref:Wzz/FepE/Etk N-terminal domain-containing protein n=1 Tax=Sphingomonas sp. KC8 TaxID=1030157 RepID=UPI0002488A20|nr:Wzz/FepE/Etk N-terminal domain-containing protein [Sphingomonas sp. KC8]ARS27324.1 LPS biosynthesis protein [Sphingomonas sp. KC8]
MSDPAFSPESEEVSENLLSHLPMILWQRRWLVIVPLLAASVAGIAAAIFLPATYRSSAVLLVESQELPRDLVGSPLTSLIDQRIAKIRQQILSRPDLIELIQNNNLYADERRSQPLSVIIEKMRKATQITPVNADIQRNNNNTTTIAFSLAFDYEEPLRAQLVAQDFVERLMKLDSSQTAAAAASTVAFLQDQATTLQEQLSQVEQQIEGIKARNGMALSSSGMMGSIMGMSGGGIETQIAALQRENATLMSQAQAAGSVEGDPIVAAATQQLATARAIYSDNHPDVKFAEQRLREARQSAAARIAASGRNNPAAAQIAANNSTIAQLQAARAGEQARANAALSAQSAAPLVMEQVAQLQARADGLRTNYERVSANLMAAQASAKMENEQRGERLSVIDPPVVPDKPTSPNRPLLVVGGAMLGGMIGLGLALLVELMLRPIRGVAALQNLLGVAPLVVVPTFQNSEPRWHKFMFWRRRKPPAQAKA